MEPDENVAALWSLGASHLDHSFGRWFWLCSRWWDFSRGEEAHGRSYLPWREWYAEGLTVGEAVRRAHASVYGDDHC